MPRDQNRRAAFAGLAATGSLLAATAAAARTPHRARRRSLRHPARDGTVRAKRRHRGLSVAPRVPAHGAGAVLPAAPAPANPARTLSGGAPNPPAPHNDPLAPAAHAARDASATAAGAVAPVTAPPAGPVESAGTAVVGAVEQADHAAAATLVTLGR